MLLPWQLRNLNLFLLTEYVVSNLKISFVQRTAILLFGLPSLLMKVFLRMAEMLFEVFELEHIISDCGNSYNLTNGNVNFDGVETTFGHTIPVTCEEGYAIEGEPHITCLPSGEWSTKTQCQIVGKCFIVS